MKKILIILITLIAMVIPMKAQQGIIIDTLEIDLSEYIGDTINSMFPINQIGTLWSVTIILEGLDNDSISLGVKGTNYQAMFPSPFMDTSMPILVTNTTNHISFWGNSQPFPYQGIWVDKLKVTTGKVRAKRVMYCPYIMYNPWEL